MGMLKKTTRRVSGKDVTRTEVPKENRAKNSSVGGHPRRNRYAMLDAGQAQARQDPGRPLGAVPRKTAEQREGKCSNWGLQR